MRILGIILFEYILGYILQGFAYCLGVYAFCVRKVEFSKYMAAGILMAIVFFVMRLLPISFGVHTILDLICLFLIGLLLLKMPPLSTIRSLLAITVLLLFTELISVFLLTRILGPEKIEMMMGDSLSKSIIALPSSVIFALLILVSYFIALKIIKKKRLINGENGT